MAAHELDLTTTPMLAWVACVMAVGGLSLGSTGFGATIIFRAALTVTLLLMPSVSVSEELLMVLVTLPMIPTIVALAAYTARDVNWPLYILIVVPSIPMIPVGTALLLVLPAGPVNMICGIVVGLLALVRLWQEVRSYEAQSRARGTRPLGAMEKALPWEIGADAASAQALLTATGDASANHNVPDPSYDCADPPPAQPAVRINDSHPMTAREIPCVRRVVARCLRLSCPCACARRPETWRWPSARAMVGSVVAGVFVGFFQGLLGVPGLPLMLLMTGLALPKTVMRGTVAMLLTTLMPLQVVYLVLKAHKQFVSHYMVLYGLATASIFVSLWGGVWLQRRMSNVTTKRTVLVLLVVSASTLGAGDHTAAIGVALAAQGLFVVVSWTLLRYGGCCRDGDGHSKAMGDGVGSSKQLTSDGVAVEDGLAAS